ncbi:phosphoesterase, partial [Paenibacillus darwinianus]
MKLRAVLTFTIIFAFFAALNFYVGWNGLLFVRPSSAKWHPVLYWIPFWILAFSYLIGRAKMLPGPAGRLLKVIGSYYFALFEFAVLILPLADLAGWLLKRSGAEREVYVGGVGTAVLLLIAALMVWGSRNAWSPVVRTYHIALPKSADGRKSLRIAVASDIHLGNVVGNRHIARLLEKVKVINPDLILLPGDVIDDSIEPFVRNR